MDTVPQSEAPNDIFSLSDRVLTEHLKFINEIGFGNWGSVWLCRPIPPITSDGSVKPLGQKLAAKVVFRSKTPTTAARVRSLWNEMKVIKSLKSERHPSIIPFHSFIITPSLVLITMSYLPTLVPVEVEESKARDWFHFLLSGVEFLHARGVVHNDIKPANILISYQNIPVLVDFGFAEVYDMSSDTAFHSDLSYGTPEYLSPERARGLPHDTRKSDVWSLGITLFEILVGRTPFEKSDGEQLNTKNELEKYWERTLRGKWVGTWNFTEAMEGLLHRMMSPNADLRCTVKQALLDSYWQAHKKDLSHKRATSCASSSSIVCEKDLDKLLHLTPSSWKALEDRNEVKILQSPPGLDVFKDSRGDVADFQSRTLFKSKSQPKVANNPKTQHNRKRAAPIADLSPIKASPTPSPIHSPANLHLNTPTVTSASASTKAKENISNFNKLAASVVAADLSRGAPGRVPFGALNQNSATPNSRPTSVVAKKPSGHSRGAKAIKVLGEAKATNTIHQSVNASYNFDASFVTTGTADRSKDSTNVKDRVMDWEREKERLREMGMLEDIERERDYAYKRHKKEKKRLKETEKTEVVKEKAEERMQNVRKEDTPDSHDLDRLQKEVPEEKARLINRTSASHSHIQIATSSRQPIDSDADVGQKQEAPKTNQQDGDSDKGKIPSSMVSPVLPMFSTGPRLTQVFNISMDTPTPAPRPTKAKGSFRHSIRASIDKTIEFCKSTSITSGRSTPARGLSFDLMRPSTKDNQESGGRAWEVDDSPPSEVVSPLPVIKNAVENEKVAADARMDRVSIWMHNTEKVLEEAKQNFAFASAPKELPLLPLPPPLSRNTPANRSTRLPRRVLAASQIFQSDESGNITSMVDQSMASNNSGFLTANDILVPVMSAPTAATKVITSTGPEELVETRNRFQVPEVNTPSRQRRATVSIGSPTSKQPESMPYSAGTSPRKEKCKSQSNLLDMHIVPISVLEAEMNKTPPPQPTPRLSEVIDPNLFIAPLRPSRDDLQDTPSRSEIRQASLDELTSSPYLVEPYPQRYSHDVLMPDTPARHRLEGVYDRFLMATSGVKRVGKGYQSENVASVANKSSGIGLGVTQSKGRTFYSTRRPMPPPVSSEDLLRKTASVDELGNWTNVEDIPNDPKEASVGFVRKAIMLIVPKATASKRMSRVI